MAKLPWEEQFLQSIPALVAGGETEERARELLNNYIHLARKTAMPEALDFEHHPELAATASPYLGRDEEIHDLMLAIVTPLLSRYKVNGLDNFEKVIPTLTTTGVTIVSNHLSHFDAAVIYGLLYREPHLKQYAERTFFIAGRLVFTSDFSRVAGRMFHSMLVASPRDMAENEPIRRELARLNIRSFKEAKERQRQGHILILYPEGTRSRDGRMGKFHSALYNYLEGTVVLPVAITGADKILHANSFTFNFTEGSMMLGEPVFVGPAAETPAGLDHLDATSLPKDTRKQDAMDAIALRLAALLPPEMRGAYAGTV
jgi:1-acyl-sn-glycerol-3-phosphate acyltransferase